MNGLARRFAVVLVTTVFTVCTPSLQVTAQNHAVSARQQQVEEKPTKDWRPSWDAVSAVVSIVAAFLSGYFFVKNLRVNRQAADRTVTVEAQQLLVEINKQYLSDPTLFAIYDDWPGRDELLRDPKLANKLKALGYLKLNVFEIVFAVLPPDGDAYDAWVAYFEDSVRRCSVLRDELSAQPEIYGRKLLAAFRRWQNTGSAKTESQPQPAPGQIPLPFATAAIGLCLSFFLRDKIGGVTASVIGFGTGALMVYLIGKVPRRE